MRERVERISVLADAVGRAQLHLRRHCDCKQMSMSCVRCENRLRSIRALDLVEDLREQLVVVEGALQDAARTLDAVMESAGDECSECIDLRAEVAPLHGY